MILGSILTGHNLFKEGYEDLHKFNHEVVLPHLKKDAEDLDNGVHKILQNLDNSAQVI